MTSVAVLQARVSSTRLPAKVLLPINGIPMVVLAAQRAANTGLRVIVATSEEKSDDPLIRILKSYGIEGYRGSLKNTLDRVVSTLKGFDDNTHVFRLTGDNVFPDGKLLDGIESVFVDQSLDYLCCNGESSGLPYGVSAELTFLKHLRDAAANSHTDYDKEHVTPFVRRKFGENYYQKYQKINKGDYRCTVDCLEDYLSINNLFSTVKDPVMEPVLQLVQQLQPIERKNNREKVTTKLAFGTAQLGLEYGVSNQIGVPSWEESKALIRYAVENGLSYIDTARDYGKSEEIIGSTIDLCIEHGVTIITKLSPLIDCPDGSADEVVKAFVDSSIFESCTSLKVQTIDVLMLHRVSHVKAYKGVVWEELLKHKAKGRIKKLGASVQTPKELQLALSIKDIEYIQMPYNILDWRWDEYVPLIMNAKKARRLEIHVRSVLLQGLFLSNEGIKWENAYVNDSKSILGWLNKQSDTFNKKNVSDFCLCFVNSLEWVDSVVVGMESLSQLEENIANFTSKNFSKQEISSIISSRPKLDEITFNPALWLK